MDCKKPSTFWLVIVFLMLLTSSLNTVIVIHFEWNRDSIAAEQCVEREIENSCCKGSCVLKERLDQLETNKEQNAPREARELPEIIMNLPAKLAPLATYETAGVTNHSCGYNAGATCAGFIPDILRPPTLG